MALEYVLRRIILLSFMLLLLSVFTFSLSFLFPGDPLSNLSGIQNISFHESDALSEKYKLDQSIPTQFISFITRVSQGDWGISFASQEPIFDHIVALFPATLELALYALLASIVFGIPAGIISAAYYKKWPDKIINTLTLLGYSTPVFWLALLMIMFFCLQLGLLPMSGRVSLLYEIPDVTGFILIDILLSDVSYKFNAFIDAIKHLLLPTIVLSTYPTMVLIRFTRDSMLEVLEKNYIKTARAKGLSRSQLIFRHALRNALLPVIKQIGLQFSTLITLAMITEVIFSWPGIGRWLIDSIYQRDFPAIQGGLLAVSTFIILATVTADLMHSLFDPISRNQTHGKI
ncbi:MULTISPECIES: ABC transporter permease [unclassified Pseudoalteromonas]|uniref:ABC transporter permease n=1 Tax=unclassified Pseudoalteromonas TaxID=194690 RepID=UPI0005A92C73|nr:MULTISPECIES: ABC transporter permease [unclassified Pseudoalteromonas]